MAPKIKRMRSARALQLKAQLNVEDTLPPIIHTTDHTTTTTTTCCLQRQQRTNSSGNGWGVAWRSLLIRRDIT